MVFSKSSKKSAPDQPSEATGGLGQNNNLTHGDDGDPVNLDRPQPPSAGTVENDVGHVDLNHSFRRLYPQGDSQGAFVATAY